MAVLHGVLPVERKWHHASSRRLGATTVSYQPFSFDFSKQFPNQDADGNPQRCTEYAAREFSQDAEQQLYDLAWIKAHVELVSGQPDGPYDIDDVIMALVVYGPSATSSPFGYPVWLDAANGNDLYDSAIALMQQTRLPLSVIAPWFPEFESYAHAFMPADFPTTWPPALEGHNFLIDRLSTVLGSKTWQGDGFDPVYWNRDALNRLLSIPGAGAFVLMPFDHSVRSILTGILYRLQIQLRLVRRQAGL